MYVRILAFSGCVHTHASKAVANSLAHQSSHLGSYNAADQWHSLLPLDRTFGQVCKSVSHKYDECLLQSWESKARHASNDKDTAQKQVAELQERLDAQGSSAQQSSQAIRANEHRTAALQRQMQVKVPAT